MLGEPILFLLVTGLTLLVFWSLGPEDAALRRRVLLVASMIAVFLYAPVAFLVCLYLSYLPLWMQRAFTRRKSARWLWLGFFGAVVPLILSRADPGLGFFATFGLAFATVKALGLVMTAYSGRVVLTASDTLFLIFFFPLFTVGPVEQIKSFTQDKFATRFDFADSLKALARIVLGLFVVYFVCSEMLLGLRDNSFGRSVDDIGNLGMARAWAFVAVSFLYTYLNFVGFSDIAIGLSRLFGLTVSENFNRPLLVTNIAEFWKRYHISMGTWINSYLYFPIVLLIKKPWAGYAGSVLAFVFFGLWHAFTVNYLIWGLGNGLSLALFQYALTQKWFDRVPMDRRLLGALGCIVTLGWVAFLQTFANLSGMDAGYALVLALIGL